MASEISKLFDDAKTWFSKVFKNAPKDAVAALSVLNTAAPYLEAVLSAVDPAVAAIVDPIVTTVQADLGTVANLLTNGNTASVGSFLSAIKANFTTLLAEAKISAPASVAKANVFLSIIDGIAAAFPA